MERRSEAAVVQSEAGGWRADRLRTNAGQCSRIVYADLTKAMKGHFEPVAMKELYLAEFQARKKAKTEGWAEYADRLKLLACWYMTFNAHLINVLYCLLC